MLWRLFLLTRNSQWAFRVLGLVLHFLLHREEAFRLTWCCVQTLLMRRHLTTVHDCQDEKPKQLDPPNTTYAQSQESMFEDERYVPTSGGDQLRRTLMKPDSPPNSRLLRVAVIGTPNAGKSTLTNRLMGWRISSVSSKVHTTRRNTLAVMTEGETQIVFVDTPGLLKPSQGKRHRLDKSLISDPVRSLESADIIGVLVDVSNHWTRNQLDPVLLELLHLHPHIPSILILNKVDSLKKKDMLLQITRTLTESEVGGVEIKVKTKKNRHKRRDVHEYLDKDTEQETDDPSLSQSREMYASRHILPLGWRSPEFLAKKNMETSVGITSNRNETVSEDGRFDDGVRDSDIAGNSSAEHENNRLNPEYVTKVRQEIKGKLGWPKFDQVFMVSALTGEGCDVLLDHFVSSAQEREWEYHSSVVTDQDPYDLARMCVWEKFLEYLPQEIPYQVYPEIIVWEYDQDGMLNIAMVIRSPNKRYSQMLVGKRGETIKRISSEAKQELMNAFRRDLRLRLQVKSKNV